MGTNPELKIAYEDAIKALLKLDMVLADAKTATVAGKRNKDMRRQDLENPIKELKFGLLCVGKIK